MCFFCRIEVVVFINVQLVGSMYCIYRAVTIINNSRYDQVRLALFWKICKICNYHEKKKPTQSRVV